MTGDVLDKYRIEAELGRGGMGVVYRASEITTGQPVAVKVMPPELTSDPMFVARFKREAKALEELKHPNIVRLLGLGEQGDLHFYVMEFIHGRTLDTFWNEKGQFSIEEAVRIAAEVARALAYAHKVGIVHRDIKPSNIMVDTEGKIRLTDFGIAKMSTATKITGTGDILGTADYMSPEQARGGATDHRSDIYSLGIVLYEMLASTVPFKGKSAIEIMKSHQFSIPDPIKKHNPKVPMVLENIVEKMIAKAPQDRYPSAEGVVAALENFLMSWSKHSETVEQVPQVETIMTSGEGAKSAQAETPFHFAHDGREVFGITPKCPACGRVVNKGDLVCTECGTNLMTGQKLETIVTSGGVFAEEKPPDLTKRRLKSAGRLLLTLACAGLVYYSRQDMFLPLLGFCIAFGALACLGAARKGEPLEPAFYFGIVSGAVVTFAYKFFLK